MQEQSTYSEAFKREAMTGQFTAVPASPRRLDWRDLSRAAYGAGFDERRATERRL